MAARRRAREYRSEQVWGDLPVVHVSVGGRQADGRYHLGRARGIFALGDVAIGLVAVGGVAVGLVAIGAVAMGLTAVGAVTAGLVGPGPRPPVGSATRQELLAEDSRRSGVRDTQPYVPVERDR
jgi:hypothetical protein